MEKDDRSRDKSKSSWHAALLKLGRQRAKPIRKSIGKNSMEEKESDRQENFRLLIPSCVIWYNK